MSSLGFGLSAIYTKEFTNAWFMFVPNPEVTTLFPRLPSSSDSDVFGPGITQTISRILPLDLTAFGLSGGELSATYSKWQVWDMGQGTYPKKGDVIFDGRGVRWSILRVRNTIYGNLYECAVQQELTPLPLVLSPSTLPGGTHAVAYSQSVTCAGQIGAVTFSLGAGTLPAGVTLTTGGLLAGTPTTPGTYRFTILSTDETQQTGAQAYTLVIA